MTRAIAVPVLADWDTYGTLSVSGISLAAGEQRMRCRREITVTIGPVR